MGIFDRWLNKDHRQLARKFYNEKNYKKAEPHLKKLLKENPHNEWAMEVLARLYMNTNRNGDALQLWKTLNQENPSIVYLRRVIDTAIKVKDWAAVREHAFGLVFDKEDENRVRLIFKLLPESDWKTNFAEMLRDQHKSVQSLFYYARCEFNEGNIEKAADMIAEIYSSGVSFKDLDSFSIKLIYEIGMTTESMQIWKNLISEIEMDLSKQRKLMNMLAKSGFWKEVNQIADNLLAENEDDLKALDAKSRSGLKLQRYSDTIEACQKMESIGEFEVRHAKRWFDAAKALEDEAEIKSSLLKLLTFEVDAEWYYSITIQVALKMKSKELVDWVLAQEMSEESKISFESLVLFEGGKSDQALSLIEDGLSQFPQNEVLMARKAYLLLEMARVEDCISVCEEILKFSPVNILAQRIRLRAGFKIWDIEKIDEEFSNALKNGSNILAMYTRYIILHLEGFRDLERGYEIINEALTVHPNNPQLLQFKALTESNLDMHDQALKTVYGALKIYPSNQELILSASQIEKAAGNQSKQLELINRIYQQHDVPLVESKDPNGSITPDMIHSPGIKTYSDGPLISVMMTVWSRNPMLDAAIDSILNQTHQNVQLIIIEDQSPDDVYTHLEKRASEDDRILLLQMPENGGTYRAKNYGMEFAKGEYFAFMDSDDFTHPQRFERQLRILNENPNAVACIQDYFRVDMDSNIEFRGNGGLRMACISLFIKREVFERIGFFDTLRVGADSEYIKRLEATYGNGSLIRDRISMMFMLKANTSLTGGGPFHISWRSITGARLQNHSSFQKWHRQIHKGDSEPFVERDALERAYIAPVEMLGGCPQWQEGMPLFGEMIQKRNKEWWAGKKDMWQKHLSVKMKGRAFAESHGVQVPDLLWQGTDLHAIPDFSELPERFVLKPERGYSANNVFAMHDGVNLLDHKEYDREKIIEQISQDNLATRPGVIYMIEEMLVGEEKEREGMIPRDFKFYMFGDKMAWCSVVARNHAKDASQNEYHFFDERFNPIQEQVMKRHPVPETILEKPDCWEQMVADAKKLGKELGIYMRIDFFACDKGSVFGEITPTPNGGKGYTDWAEKYLGSFWKGEEGVE